MSDPTLSFENPTIKAQFISTSRQYTNANESLREDQSAYDVTPPAKKRKTQNDTAPNSYFLHASKPKMTTPSKDSQHYDHDTVIVMLGKMKEAGYGDRKKQKKSLKDVFVKAIELAQQDTGIKRTAKGWQKNSRA